MSPSGQENPAESMEELRKRYTQRIRDVDGRERAAAGADGASTGPFSDPMMGGPQPFGAQRVSTRQYQQFKEQYLPKPLSFYEKACALSEKLMRVSPDAKGRPKVEEAIRVCHLEATPEGVSSFALLAPMLFILLVTGLGFFLPMGLAAMAGEDPFAAGSMFLLLFGMVGGLSMIIPLQRLPFYFANSWRMQASNQMVLCTFYIVTYMRHTSNLERAVDFAGEHLAPPLSIDMKKVVWDIETEKYGTIKESLDAYLENWKEWNPEFIESMHLIEGSLVEGSESRRVELLDKSLSVMLDETYEKMLHYAHNLKSPLTTLHMLGVILPILGLVILPLMVNFIPEARWFHMAVVYNVTLPVLVYVIAKSILSTRPSGYGNADITDLNPDLKKQQTIRIPLGGGDALSLSPLLLGFLVAVIGLLLAAVPFIYHFTSPDRDWIYGGDGLREIDVTNPDERADVRFWFLDYRPEDAKIPDSPRTVGPFGLGAVLFSLLVPLALGVGLGMYYTIRARNIIKIREETRKLEQEFASALFQLGNRLADGIPAEIAFAKVADVLQGTRTGTFYDTVTSNISRLGMGLEDAIFDAKVGAIHLYPSPIIESSMKVLVESNKKGPLVASQALINVSEYIKQMHRVDERLRDLMSDVISSMKSQVSFLTPVIAGIVIGITSMISSILGTIGGRLGDLAGQAGGTGTNLEFLSLFGGASIPIYHFQAIVGLYVVQITWILTIMVNGIENGVDNIGEQDSLGKNLLRSTILYVMISAITIILFSMIAGNIATLN
jgi:hypothetical protein